VFCVTGHCGVMIIMPSLASAARVAAENRSRKTAVIMSFLFIFGSPLKVKQGSLNTAMDSSSRTLKMFFHSFFIGCVTEAQALSARVVQYHNA